ncbi:MAG: chemotaxis response regulator protein-glutamate methylesterase [Pseudomonadota bacterium]
MAARVLIVDDSTVMRRMMRSMLDADPELQVVAEAEDTPSARALIKQHDPDVVTLDVEMPGMNGLDFLQKIMQLRPTPVIMVSSLTTKGADTTLAALQIGAVDVVHKPGGTRPLAEFGATLREKVRLAAGVNDRRPAEPARAVSQSPLPTNWRPEFIAIGASTGGVGAVTDVLRGLPLHAPPVLIVQHMPEGFTGRFATRLNGQLPQQVAEARDEEPLLPGTVRIAPGGAQLGVALRAGHLISRIVSAPQMSGHRPSVDFLFDSLARTGRRGLAVILTGMGRDGARGVGALSAQGSICIVQDQETSVVFGMPRAAIETGKVHQILPLPAIAPYLCTFSKPNPTHSPIAS